MSEEGATSEQKRSIAAYFIASSPTGEVDEVVTDVRKLIPDSAVLSEEFITKTLKDYNVEQLVTGPDPEGVPCIVSPYGQVGDDLFLDPSSGRVMRFDHKNRKFIEVTDKKQVLDEGVNKYRSAIEAEVKSYVTGSYKTGKAVCAVYGTDSGVITICISAANVHLGNFWTGGWRSVYQFSVASQGSTELKTDIKINVHYFEDGNVQLHTKFPAKSTISIADEKKNCRYCDCCHQENRN